MTPPVLQLAQGRDARSIEHGVERFPARGFGHDRTPWTTAASDADIWPESAELTASSDAELTVDSADHLFAALSTRDLQPAARPTGGRAQLRAIAASLDGLGVAICAFDSEGRTLFWNETFLSFFPEQAGFIHEGEPCRVHLRRFYESRLDAADLASIESHLDGALARHTAPQPPQVFSHRGFWLQATSQISTDGAVCTWTRCNAAPTEGDAERTAEPMIGLAGGLDLFEHVGEGIMLTDPEGRIRWVNEAFVAMYRLTDKASASGARFVDVYRAAWRGVDGTEWARFEAGATLLADNMRFAGAPFELPLPGNRFVRVVEQRRPDGFSCFAHVDISILKRRQHQLIRAERRARESAAKLAAQSKLLDALLERIEEGVMVIDTAGAVEVCNQRAAELLGLPADGVAANGDGGRLVEGPARRAPDGRTIEIQSVPIDGIGVLRMLTDVTGARGASRERNDPQAVCAA
jgi:PAS domain-containing protein